MPRGVAWLSAATPTTVGSTRTTVHLSCPARSRVTPTTTMGLEGVRLMDVLTLAMAALVLLTASAAETEVFLVAALVVGYELEPRSGLIPALSEAMVASLFVGDKLVPWAGQGAVQVWDATINQNIILWLPIFWWQTVSAVPAVMWPVAL